MKSYLNEILCILFHKIRIINHCLFVDIVSGEKVGQYDCIRCNRVFMANSKRSWFRVYKAKQNEAME